MGKIKIKDIEGDAQDIKALLKDLNCDMATYLGATVPPKRIPLLWLYLSVPLFIILATSEWIGVFNPILSKVSIIGLFFLYSCIVLIFHYNFKNWSLTTIAGIAGLIIILLALNVYTPQEVAKKIESHAINSVEHSK
jgi:hypothetical protein